MLDARFSQLYFRQSLHTLQLELPAIAGLLVYIHIWKALEKKLCVGEVWPSSPVWESAGRLAEQADCVAGEGGGAKH